MSSATPGRFDAGLTWRGYWAAQKCDWIWLYCQVNLFYPCFYFNYLKLLLCVTNSRIGTFLDDQGVH